MMRLRGIALLFCTLVMLVLGIVLHPGVHTNAQASHGQAEDARLAQMQREEWGQAYFVTFSHADTPYGCEP